MTSFNDIYCFQVLYKLQNELSSNNGHFTWPKFRKMSTEKLIRIFKENKFLTPDFFREIRRSHEINFSKKRTEERVYTLKITLVCKILTWLTNQFVYYWMGLKCWTPCSIIFRSVETILHPFDFLTKPWQILKTNIYETTFTWIAINYQF